MSEEEKKLRYLQTLDGICRHIENVQRNCRKLGEALIMKGEYDFGKTLIAHAYVHDNSKFTGIEFDYLTQKEDRTLLKVAVRNHQSTNPHHPEYWGTIQEMPRIYIAEMAADWLARSQEFGTDIRKWIKENACTKYGFAMDDEIGKEIFYFLSLMCDEVFQDSNLESGK